MCRVRPSKAPWRRGRLCGRGGRHPWMGPPASRAPGLPLRRWWRASGDRPTSVRSSSTAPTPAPAHPRLSHRCSAGGVRTWTCEGRGWRVARGGRTRGRRCLFRTPRRGPTPAPCRRSRRGEAARRMQYRLCLLVCCSTEAALPSVPRHPVATLAGALGGIWRAAPCLCGAR